MLVDYLSFLFCITAAGYRKPCQAKYWESVSNSQPTAYIPRCRRDGDFEPMQCDRQDCWCVEPQGIEVNGTRSRGTITCPPGTSAAFTVICLAFINP